MSETIQLKQVQSPRALFRQPLALQWYYDGQLKKRKDDERQAGRFELFLDLLYVAILANFAENLAEHPSGVAVVKYILILAPSWHIWSDLRELMNSFYTDDLAQRVLILWIMTLLVIYGNNATLVEEDIGALRATVGAYMVGRLSTNTVHLVYSFSSYHHRAQQRLWFVLSTLALCIYIPLYMEDLSFRSKIAVAAVGIAVEESIWIFSYSPAAKKLLNAKYTTAVDIPHEVDRFAAFYIIVLGEFLYQIIVGSPASIGFNLPLLRAVWTLIIAFCLNWLYLHGDGSLDCSHPLRHSVFASFAWVTLHLPMLASLLVAGHVSAHSTKVTEIHEPELWLLCGGLCVGVFCLYIIALLHNSNDPPGTLMLPKHFRLMFRPIIAIIIICLPLSHGLDITSFLSIIMALLAFVVIWENITSLMRGAKFWEKWVDTAYPEEGARSESVSGSGKEEVGETSVPYHYRPGSANSQGGFNPADQPPIPPTPPQPSQYGQPPVVTPLGMHAPGFPPPPSQVQAQMQSYNHQMYNPQTVNPQAHQPQVFNAQPANQYPSSQQVPSGLSHFGPYRASAHAQATNTLYQPVQFVFGGSNVRIQSIGQLNIHNANGQTTTIPPETKSNHQLQAYIEQGGPVQSSHGQNRPTPVHSQDQPQNYAQLRNQVQFQNWVHLHNQVQLQKTQSQLETKPLATTATSSQNVVSQPAWPPASAIAGQVAFAPTTTTTQPQIPGMKPVKKSATVPYSTANIHEEQSKCGSGARPRMPPSTDQPAASGKLDAKTYTDLSERKKAIEKKFAAQFPRVRAQNMQPTPGDTKLKAESKGPPGVLRPRHNAVDTAPSLTSNYNPRIVQSQSFQNDQTLDFTLVKPELAIGSSECLVRNVQVESKEQPLPTASNHAKETAQGGSPTKPKTEVASNKGFQANGHTSKPTSQSNAITTEILRAHHPTDVRYKVPLKSIKPTVPLIAPDKVKHTAGEPFGSVKSPKPIQTTTSRSLVVQKKSSPLLVPKSIGLEYSDSLSSNDDADKANSHARTPKPELRTSQVTKAPSVKASPATKSASQLLINELSARIAQEKKLALEAEFQVAMPHNTRRNLAVKPSARLEPIDPDLDDFGRTISMNRPQAVDPDLHDFLLATEADPREKSAGTEDQPKPKTDLSLGRYFKKSFVDASLLNKHPKDKIRISEVKSRPGLDVDPELIQRGILRFDYTDLDRPKVPRPSLSRPSFLEDDALVYDEPGSRLDIEKPSKNVLRSPPTLSRVVSKESSPPYSPPPATLPIAISPPPASLPTAVPRKRRRSGSKSTPTVPTHIQTDLDVEETIVVDCTQLQSRVSSAETDNEEPVQQAPKRRRLVRRSELYAEQGKTSVHGEKKAVEIAEKATNTKPSTEPRTVDVAGRDRDTELPNEKSKSVITVSIAINSSIRYATEDEMKRLTGSIQDAQTEARKKAHNEKPKSYAECVLETSWEPYQCIACPQTFSQNSEMAKHVEKSHLIILPRKFKAWQCLFPKCPKGFCDRNGAIKHARTHFGKG
ncbi:hypothetical protein VTL71DRAFT_6959 [Oculimacula yallundae]|uniref:C2H2-type domain-containing protein n=1 Tax=Oculimacula yallundae TaxID=86028 RepID=A0ABR4BVB0_9HELO